MTELVLMLFNMNISASWLVLAVILLRVLFRKAPKWMHCLVWSIVALRLSIPFSLESAFSLLPSGQVIPLDIATTQTPAIYSGIPEVNSAINPLFTQYLAPETQILETILAYVPIVWLIGVAVLLLYSVISCWRLRWQVRASIQTGRNLYLCDDVQSPFILGVFAPKIYVPSGIDEAHLKYVLAHENAHIKRLDHWWKPLGFLLLTVYWFNPLLWIAYILLCRDIEQACDEKVIAQMDPSGKRHYSEALVACSVHRKMIMSCPIAFGEIAVKTRIKDILCYKKPSFWIILTTTAACIVTAVCFLTNPISCKHTYTGEQTVCSTCTEKGIQTFHCSLCGHSYTARSALLAHNYRQGDVIVEADCLHLGSIELICIGCGAAKTEAVEKTGHLLGMPFLSKEPNCAETGEMSARCSLCHMEQVVEIIACNHDHDLYETVVEAASCEIPGKGIIACSRCDYTQSYTYPQLGHNYVYGTTYPGTCIRDGFQDIICTVCGFQYTKSIPGTGEHTWSTSPTDPIHCVHCGCIKPGVNDQWGYGPANLIKNGF